MTKRTTPQTQAIDVAVGGRVRLRRQALKMSQSVLAKALGITFQQLQKCEMGVNRIGAGRLYQIAIVLKAPIEFFFEDVGDALDVASASGEGGDIAKQSARLAKAFSRIDDAETRRHVAALIDRLSGN